ILEIMSEEKANQKERIKIPTERLRKYFPKNYSTSQIEEAIIKMCESHYRKKQQQKER
ncbi:MAG TPA: chromosome partitioning protein ParB, partial [Ruminococcus sp.]|nr:chromosome partitioning protein ParB [Ruminococcus sp.]